MKKWSLFVTILLSFLLLLPACGKSPSEPGDSSSMQETQTPISLKLDVSQDEKFDTVYLNMTIEDFLAAGFQFGDSCDVSFSNGLSFEDIPLYNGYYVRPGDPLVIGYPGYPYIGVTLKNNGLWTQSGLKNGDSGTVTLREAGKYLDVQETLNQTYSNDRKDYGDDVTFANFRALSGGKMKEGFAFRGASPVDNEKNRAAYVDTLIKENDVRFILDLADSEDDLLGFINEEDFCSDYTKSLVDSGSVALLDMNADYSADTFKGKLASGLKKMLSAEGKVYIHCLEGKDRTGFVCTLLEALSGAGYDEMCSDYMKTYENYYRVTPDKKPEAYNAIVDLYFNAFLEYLHGTDNLEELQKADYVLDAENYLLDAGMTQEEIDALKALLTE